MIAVVSIVCVTSVVLYGMRLYVSRLATAETATKLAEARSDLATVSGRLSDLQQTVKDAQLSRIDRMEQQIQGIHARMGTRG